MEFKPTFYEIKLPNKDIKVVVNYAPDCNAHFTYCHNSITGDTYTGLQCDTFVDSLRGLLRQFPLFFESISESNYRKDLNRMGIHEITAPERMKQIYEIINQ